jgi:TetR/AcrR family transcriptional repressor of nem operon
LASFAAVVEKINPASEMCLQWTERSSHISVSMKPGSDTKQRLLDITLTLLWEQSYGAVSVDDICRKAGAAKGSFYHFFESKSALVVASSEELWRQTKLELDRIFSSQTPPLVRFVAFGDFIYELQRKKREETGKICGCPFASLGSEMSTLDERIQMESEQILERFCLYFSSALIEAAKCGVVPDFDPEAKARELYSCVMGTLIEAKIMNSLDVVRQLKGRLLRMIEAPAAHSGPRGFSHAPAPSGRTKRSKRSRR